MDVWSRDSINFGTFITGEKTAIHEAKCCDICSDALRHALVASCIAGLPCLFFAVTSVYFCTRRLIVGTLSNFLFHQPYSPSIIRKCFHTYDTDRLLESSACKRFCVGSLALVIMNAYYDFI